MEGYCVVGELVAGHSGCIGFCSESPLSQKKIIHMALMVPMTINELYRALPTVSEQNIAPLVAQLVQENKAWVVGRRKAMVSCGIERMQNIYSCRDEDRPRDNSESIALLDSIFGACIPNLTGFVRVHSMADE